MALLLETGLLLILIPWSVFWERNYFIQWSGAVSALLTSNYTRGALTGLGLVNVWAAVAELGDLFGNRHPSDPESGINPPPEIRDRQ